MRTPTNGIAPHLLAVDLTNQLPYLLRRAHFEAEAVFAELFDSLAATPRQSAVLLTVAQQPGVSQASLSDQLGLDANTLSSIVARLLRKRLIRRERSATDKRRYGLQVTEAGYRQLAQFLPSVGKYQQRVARRLSADEREQLIVLLQRLLGFENP
jgi:MarR family transcriptional regulator, temperature-dependent positive regulator of motility